jgi:Ferritin-like domain
MSGDGVGIGITVPTTPTLPPLPTVPTVPTLPPLTTPPPTGPTVPTVPGSGSTSPPPASSSPPPASSSSSPGSSGSPSGSAGPSGSSNPPSASTSTAPDCPSQPAGSSSPPSESSGPPDESSIQSSEPEQPEQATTQPDQAPTPTDGCEPTGPESTGDGSTHPLPGEVAEDELAIVAVAASMEVLAVDAYTTVREAGTTAGFGDLPPAIAQYVDTAVDHHQVALDAWNAVLVAAGRPAINVAPVDLASAISEQLGAVTDGAGAARVALGLERLVAATYLEALGKLVSEPAIRLAGSIMSVDRQHMSLLLFAIGEYPVPETFATAESAYVPADA